MPLGSAQLVEGQNVDVLDGILELLTYLGHLFDVLLRIGQAGDQDETYPDLAAPLCQPLPKGDCRSQRASGDLLVCLLVTRLDIQKAQIDVIYHVVRVVAVEEARGVETGVDTHLLGCTEDTRYEGGLHHRFAPTEGDAPARRLEEVLVARHLVNHGLEVHGLTVTHLPGIGILAVLTPERASAHEYGHPGSGTIHRRIDVPRMYKSDIARTQGRHPVVPVQPDG